MKKNDDINPGEQLQELLREICPPDAEDNSFISRIDYLVDAEGELKKLIYDSTINYVLRRLISTADFLKRQCDKQEKYDESFIVKLREFLKENMRFPEENIELIRVLITECLDAKRKKVNSTLKKEIRRTAKNNNRFCYLCGIELEYDLKSPNNVHNSVEVEHKWPRAMGGLSDAFNLEVACQACNGKKADYIDASDFHYEEICLVTDENDQHFSTEMKREYELALWAKTEFKCSLCQKPASDSGKLKLSRKNPNDSWHFLNIEIFCEQHSQLRR
ncbi:MAG TPA: hypothetical protein DCQ51_00920 [Planktothrix sp. UBA8407]|jgi:hypothetical protein|nr:hypothetical protein [Planktothrix sp. UBA8407]